VRSFIIRLLLFVYSLSFVFIRFQDSQPDIDLGSFAVPKVFDWLAQTGGLERDEMLKTFNCGIGMAVIVEQHKAEDVLALLKGAVVMGSIVETPGVQYRGELKL